MGVMSVHLKKAFMGYEGERHSSWWQMDRGSGKKQRTGCPGEAVHIPTPAYREVSAIGSGRDSGSRSLPLLY